MRRLAVLSAVYPTKDDHAKGRPIWATIDQFPRDLDFTVYCSLPWRPAWLRRLAPPRSYMRYPKVVDSSAAWFRAEPLVYFSLPGVGRNSNGRWLSRALRSRLGEPRPDAILAYRAYPEGYAAVLTGRRLGAPAIISVRGSDLRALPASGPIRRKTEIAMREAAAVLAVSQDLSGCALALGANPDRVHLVRNGVDRQVFRPEAKAAARAALNFPADARLVLFVGNLLPVKGLPVLVEAIAELRRQSAFNLQLAIIGDGNLEPQLRAQTDNAGMREAVHFLGQRRPVEIAGWMNAADLLCLPSESEGLPNVVLEAFSCGCPVVGTAVGGTPELITPGCGLLVPARDATALRQAIAEALATRWDAASIAGQPIDSWEQVAAKTLAICAQAVEKSRA